MSRQYDFDTSKGVKTFLTLRTGRKIWTSVFLSDRSRVEMGDTPDTGQFIADNLIVSAMFEFQRDMYKGGIISAHDSQIQTATRFSPEVALKTGRLRNAFHKMLQTAKVALTTGSQHFNSIVDIEFELRTDDLVPLLEYAQYHIQELTGKTSYKDPTTKNTKPISITQVSILLMDLFRNSLFNQLWGLGWDIDANLQVDILSSLGGKIVI